MPDPGADLSSVPAFLCRGRGNLYVFSYICGITDNEIDMNWLRRYVSLTLIVVVAFVFFVLFFNDNSILQSFEYNRQIQALKDEIRANEDTLRYYRDLNERLNTDPETMERIVREQYHMQRPSEDVYVFD